MKQKKVFLVFTLAIAMVFTAGCGKERKVENKNVEVEEAVPNDPSDFQYKFAKDLYGQELAEKAVKAGEISSVNSVIIQKYIGEKTDVVIPEEIEGNPVEIIDNFAFSPFNAGVENDAEFWTKVLDDAGLPHKGNGSTKGLMPDYKEGAFNAFMDACVSTNYIKHPSNSGKHYDPKMDYVYFDDDYNKAVDYLKNHEKFSKITSVVIPESTFAIGGGAFMFCDSMEKVETKGYNIRVNDYAFAFCTSLKETKLRITADTDCCYLGCVSLEKAWNSGHHIGTMMFACCPELNFVSIGRQMKYAKDKAFYRCPSLESAHFPLMFKLSPEFLDFNTFTAILSDRDVSYKEFNERGWPYKRR